MHSPPLLELTSCLDTASLSFCSLPLPPPPRSRSLSLALLLSLSVPLSAPPCAAPLGCVYALLCTITSWGLLSLVQTVTQVALPRCLAPWFLVHLLVGISALDPSSLLAYMFVSVLMVSPEICRKSVVGALGCTQCRFQKTRPQSSPVTSLASSCNSIPGLCCCSICFRHCARRRNVTTSATAPTARTAAPTARAMGMVDVSDVVSSVGEVGPEAIQSSGATK
jgi:hypothetical protein